MKRTILGAAAALTVLFSFGADVALATFYSDTVQADGPILHYRLEEVGGATVVDSSPTAAHGTYMGGVTLQQPSFSLGLGSAAAFDGLSGWVDVPALGSFPQATVELWLNMAGNPAGGCCTSLYSTDSFSTGNLHFNIKSGRDVEHAIASGGPNNINTPGGVIQSGVWYHVVGTYDTTAGGATQIYVNGTSLANVPHAAAPLAALVDAQIAGWNGARYFGGAIDEFAIYDTALSAAQVQAHFAAGSVVIPEPSCLVLAACALAGFGLLMGRRRMR